MDEILTPGELENRDIWQPPFSFSTMLRMAATIRALAAALRVAAESIDDLKMHALKLDVARDWTSVPTVEWEQAIERADVAHEPVKAWMDVPGPR